MFDKLSMISVFLMVKLYGNMPNRRRAFFSLILRTSIENFRPTLGASLIRDFFGNHNKKLKFTVHFLTVLKTVPWYDRTLKRTSFWTITNRFGLAQQDKIGSETRANL